MFLPAAMGAGNDNAQAQRREQLGLHGHAEPNFFNEIYKMSKSRTIQIITNPTSGRGRGSRTAAAVASILRARSRSVDVFATKQTGDAHQVTLDVSAIGDPPACVVACGGDGTIQEVAHALATRKTSLGDRCPALGLAPAGRCNDFARALGVGKDPATIADILTTGSPTALDLGLVNGRHFCTVATVGVDAEISRYVDTMRMPLTGTLAYLYGAMCVLARYKPLTLHLRGDFDEIRRPIFLASSANTSSYGGAIRIAPDASPTDGFLDICVVDAVHPFRVPRLVGAILRGKHTRKPEVHILRTRQLHIDATETLAIWADGERVAETPATLSAAPQAIRVILPSS